MAGWGKRPWWQDEGLGFDTESTGLKVRKDHIITFALVTVGISRPSCEAYTIDPGVDIPADATAIHGITTDHVRKHGMPAPEGLEIAAAALATVLSKGMPVAGMNLAYDLSLLHANCRRLGVPTLSERLGGHDKVRPIVDCMVMDGHVSYRKGPRNLLALCRHYGVRHYGAHHAGYDALAAADVAATIARRYPTLGDASLDELHDRQITWAAQRNASRQKYEREKGNKDFVATTGWPLYDEVIAANPSP